MAASSDPFGDGEPSASRPRSANGATVEGAGSERPLVAFELYETRSRYYLVGRTADSREWRTLKVSRRHANELELEEDKSVYGRDEMAQALAAARDGNRSTGGMQLTCRARAVVGFVRFLGPYYIILATEARSLGRIAGHEVLEVAGTKLVPVPEPSAMPQMDRKTERAERRYLKLLQMVDLSRPGFIFSDTYPLAMSMQHACAGVPADSSWKSLDSRWVWNGHLAADARRQLDMPERWLRPLVHGHFASVCLSVFGRRLRLTLIARRSRIFAGTRYLKRGLSDGGYVANDVEVEQVVEVERVGVRPGGVSSFVQVRGSIPLFWGQEISPLSPLKPDIVLQRADPLYRATRRHYDDLEARYGKPVVSLSLVKTHERRQREVLLQREFASAISHLNSRAGEEHESLLLLHWDMAQYARRRERDVVSALMPIAAATVDRNKLFTRGARRSPPHPGSLNIPDGSFAPRPKPAKAEAASTEWRQSGAVRTNCIDCLDRTNVAQFVIGLAALRVQLWALGVTDMPDADQTSAVASELMSLYEGMGNMLAMQYGGSDAHQMVFQQIKGEWAPASKSRDVLTSIKRFYSNTYTDSEKQDAINLFLGNFVPSQGQPQLWEFDSDWYLHRAQNEPAMDVPHEELASNTRILDLGEGRVGCPWDARSAPEMAFGGLDNFDLQLAQETVAPSRFYNPDSASDRRAPRKLFSLGLLANGAGRSDVGVASSPGRSGTGTPGGLHTPGSNTPGASRSGTTTPRQLLSSLRASTGGLGSAFRRTEMPSPASGAEDDAGGQDNRSHAQRAKLGLFNSVVFAPRAVVPFKGIAMGASGLDVELCVDRESYSSYVDSASPEQAAASFAAIGRVEPAASLCGPESLRHSDIGSKAASATLLDELWPRAPPEQSVASEYQRREEAVVDMAIVPDVQRSAYAIHRAAATDVHTMVVH